MNYRYLFSYVCFMAGYELGCIAVEVAYKKVMQ